MAKRTVPFTINIADSGESVVEYAITEKERKAILNAIEEGEMFEESESLQSLYERVMVAAKEKILEDLDLTCDDDNAIDIDPDALEYNVDFADEDEYL